jgi:hypothetical protein
MFNQLYILEPDAALERRTAIRGFQDLNRNLLRELDRELRQCNPLAERLKFAFERYREACEQAAADAQPPQFRMCIYDVRNNELRNLFPNLHPHQMNPVTAEEVAGVFVSPLDGEVPSDQRRGFYLYADGDYPHKIGLWNRNRDFLCYPLIFPCADQTYGYRIPRYDPVGERFFANEAFIPEGLDDPEPGVNDVVEIEDLDDIAEPDHSDSEEDRDSVGDARDDGDEGEDDAVGTEVADGDGELIIHDFTNIKFKIGFR